MPRKITLDSDPYSELRKLRGKVRFWLTLEKLKEDRDDARVFGRAAKWRAPRFRPSFTSS